MTDRFINAPAGSASGAQASPDELRGDPKKVMVIHGRDVEATSSMFQLLQALALEPLEWSSLVAETKTGTPYIGDVLDSAFSIARAAVVLLTPDEEVRLRHGLRSAGDSSAIQLQARPNVFYEAGLAFGRFPKETVVVEVGEMRGASDLGGRHAIRVSSEVDWRHDLADRLKTVGCDVDTSGREWLRVGKFSEALGARPNSSVTLADDTDRRATGDQALLDRLLRVLSREAIRVVGAYDFGSAWPRDLMYPINKFLNEQEGVEYEFDDPVLEERRVGLRQKAQAFVLAEAMNGFPADRDWRNTGWASSELEVNREAFEIADDGSARSTRRLKASSRPTII